MTKLHIGPAMRYQWGYMWRSGLQTAGVLLGIMLIVNIISSVLYVSYTESSNNFMYTFIEAFNINTEHPRIFLFDLGGVFAIMLFIAGIASIREDLRFFIQHGMGRITTCVANILIGLIAAAGAGLFSEIISFLSNNVSFLHGGVRWFPSDNFFVSWLLHSLSFFLAWQLGTLISLIYYRLNTVMKVVFSVVAGALFLGIIPGVSIPRIIFFGIPLTFSAGDGSTLLDFFNSSAYLGLIIAVIGILCAIGNFLLIRRATIK